MSGRVNLRALVLRGLRRLPEPRDEAAIRAAVAVRDLVAGRRPSAPARQTVQTGQPGQAGRTGQAGRAGVVAGKPGTSVVRVPTGLPKVPPLPGTPAWRRPQGITGSGRTVRSLYETGDGGGQVFDVDLLNALNAEYRDNPLVPSPPSYGDAALAEAAERRVRWVDGMVGLRGLRTLEIGCGNGFEVWSLAHNLGCDAHGVDVTHYRPWDQLRSERVSFACADLSDPSAGSSAEGLIGVPTDSAPPAAARGPYEPGSFDRVLSFTVWEHVTHPYAMLKSTYDLLKPGGLAWIRANLYAGPQASHRYRDIHFPWPHLLFTDQVVREWDVSHGRRPIGNAWVNRLSWLHYEYYADLLGFEVAHRSFTETPIDEAFYTRFEDVLGRYPRADLRRDYFLMVLRKPL